jgi:Complex 1 protein (LYR family)
MMIPFNGVVWNTSRPKTPRTLDSVGRQFLLTTFHFPHFNFMDFREVPRILAIFDIDMPAAEAKSKVRDMFSKNAQVRDERVLDMLVEKGYMELEETLLQHKQRPHLLRLLDGDSISYTGANRKKLGPNATTAEMFARN